MTVLSGSASPFREAEIDVAKLAHNVARFREQSGGAAFFAEVGAEAWGHGLDIVVPALVELGAEAFIVARLDEAERVRALAAEILIITTQHSADETFEKAAALNVAPAVRSRSELERSIEAGVRAVVLVEDDGEGLPGFDPSSLLPVTEETEKRGIVVLLGSVLKRVGAELFGVSEDDGGAVLGFLPVMRLWAPVVATKRVGAAEGVSYGYTYRTSGETTLALVSLGYADGIDRAGSNQIAVSLEGGKYTVAGRVAMDALVLDLGDVAAPALGAEAVVLGDAHRGEPTAFQQAVTLGTHSAEITTRLSARPHRSASERQI